MKKFILLFLLLTPSASYSGLIDPTMPGYVPVRQTATVSTLPTCNAGAKGAMYLVTDSLLPAALATVSGGGAVVVGVMCNGTNWIVN